MRKIERKSEDNGMRDRGLTGDSDESIAARKKKRIFKKEKIRVRRREPTPGNRG